MTMTRHRDSMTHTQTDRQKDRHADKIYKQKHNDSNSTRVSNLSFKQ